VVRALAGKRNVIILERTDEPMAGDNPMGRDIRTALSKAMVSEGHPATEGLPAITSEQMPRLFGGIYGLGSRDFRPSTFWVRMNLPPVRARAGTEKRLRMASHSSSWR